MITEKHGNLLDDDAQALVNTVNCVGVMGKGIALAFKSRYPQMFQDYRADCFARRVLPGSVRPWRAADGSGPIIVNVATKAHWREPSQMQWVDDALFKLAALVREQQITSIAVPPLGCGNGGLDWEFVKPFLLWRLGERSLPGVDVRLYVPIAQG